MSSVLAVARLRPVLADADLFAEHVPDDPRSDLAAGRREVSRAVAPECQHVGMERRAFLCGQAFDAEPLAFAHAVLLAADRDDCVGHGSVRAKAGVPPAAAKV